jgi:hypothetical protein
MPDQCCPNLGLNGIGGGSHKVLIFRLCLRALKKRTNLPAILRTNGGDGCGAPLQVIGKKNEALFFLSITELNTASGIRTFFGSADTAENNEIILQNGTILRDVSCLNHGINNVSF